MQSRQPDLLAAEFVTFPAAAVFLLLRIISRRVVRTGFWWDDYFAIGCFATAIAWAVMIPLWVERGFGLHSDQVEGMTMEEANYITKKYMFFIEYIYAFALFFAKMSILFFYWRMFRVSNIKIAIQVLMGCSIIWILIRIFLTSLQCFPIEYVWDDSIKDGYCVIDATKFFFGTVLTHVLIDIAILILPIVQIQKLQLPLLQKICIILMFMFGILVCIAGIVIVDVCSKYDITSADLDWNMAPIVLWATVEVNLVTISTCLPTIRPACLYIFGCGNPGSTIGSGSKNYGQSYSRSQTKKSIRLTNLPKGATSSTHELASPGESGSGSISDDFESHALDGRHGNIATVTVPNGGGHSNSHPGAAAFRGGILVQNETMVRVAVSK
ncbi:hypothetical protein FDECE_6475 [Fusarium decemcellulare]|nr:hypothetical protein FDECE_6475 [Fusarium decemcellulare]